MLRSLPETAAALADGAITAEHADVIVNRVIDGTFGDTATTEQALLPTALAAGADEFARAVRRDVATREIDLADRDAQRAFRRRSARFVHHRDGTVSLHSLLPATAGTLVEQAVAAMTSPDPAGTPAELVRTPDQRRADGLIDLVTAAIACGVPPESGGVRPHINVLVPYQHLQPAASAGAVGPVQAATTGRVGPASQASQAGPVGPVGPVGPPSQDAIADPVGPAQAAAGGVAPADLDGHGPIARSQLRRLLCDAGITRIVTAGASQILDVGRETRTWPVPTRKAIAARDRGCRFPSCDRPAAWCDVHHVHWGELGGHTNVTNGVLLCGFHHHLIHDDRWTLDMHPTTAVVTIHNPTGTIRLTSHPPGFEPPPLFQTTPMTRLFQSTPMPPRRPPPQTDADPPPRHAHAG